MGHLAALLLLLAGCVTPRPAEVARPSPTLASPEPPRAALQSYVVSPAIGTQCVPYARSRSGIALRGDAYTWWDTAAGQFARGSKPVPGAVLVLRRTSRLRYGHVAVVASVTGPREIRIDHANWQPAAIITGMAVMDVSPANDWTQLRFWNKDARMWGRIYPAAGFVYNLPDGAVPPAGAVTTIVSGKKTVDVPPQQSTP